MSSLLKSDDTKYEYLFDGNNISLLKDGGVVKSWKAVSGKDGYQSPEFQNVKGKGPIPEGEYDVRQGRLFYPRRDSSRVGRVHRPNRPKPEFYDKVPNVETGYPIKSQV